MPVEPVKISFAEPELLSPRGASVAAALGATRPAPGMLMLLEQPATDSAKASARKARPHLCVPRQVPGIALTALPYRNVPDAVVISGERWPSQGVIAGVVKALPSRLCSQDLASFKQ